MRVFPYANAKRHVRTMPARLCDSAHEAVVHALKRENGVTAISRYVVAAELRTGSLAAIRIRGWNVRNVVSVLRVRDAKLTPSADRFQSFVRARLGQLARQRAR